jgi:hypothetical protein
MQASDGTFNQVQEDVQAVLLTSGLGLGRHMIFVRGKDNTGTWGPMSATFYTQLTDSQIRGKVTDAANDNPLSGAHIALQSSQMSVQASLYGQGNYFAHVLSGTYTATATLFGYSPVVVGGIVASTNMTTTQDFSLMTLPIGTFDGEVRDLKSNSPLQATIVISGTPVTLSTNPQSGVFSTTLPIGTYTLVVSAPGYYDFIETELQIYAGQVTYEGVFLSPIQPIYLPLIRAGGP